MMAEDSVSSQVSIPDGFPFGNSNQTTVYVWAAGTIPCIAFIADNSVGLYKWNHILWTVFLCPFSTHFSWNKLPQLPHSSILGWQWHYKRCWWSIISGVQKQPIRVPLMGQHLCQSTTTDKLQWDLDAYCWMEGCPGVPRRNKHCEWWVSYEVLMYIISAQFIDQHFSRNFGDRWPALLYYIHI